MLEKLCYLRERCHIVCSTKFMLWSFIAEMEKKCKELAKNYWNWNERIFKNENREATKQNRINNMVCGKMV